MVGDGGLQVGRGMKDRKLKAGSQRTEPGKGCSWSSFGEDLSKAEGVRRMTAPDPAWGPPHTRG